jgi:hypothetical protein
VPSTLACTSKDVFVYVPLRITEPISNESLLLLKDISEEVDAPDAIVIVSNFAIMSQIYIGYFYYSIPF